MDMLTFEEEIHREPIDLPRAALRFAQEICYPELDVNIYLSKLDDLADSARQAISADEKALVRAVQTARYLFQEVGFQGNAGQYGDPRNSYLNDVLERRLGIPISLSVIFIAVSERLDLPVQGIGLPGHFIVSVQGENGPLYLDPFDGGQQLSVIDCARLVEQSTGYTGPFKPEWLRTVQPSYILARMLFNLRNVYIQQDNWRMALPVVEHLHVLQPDVPDHLRDLGIILHQVGSLAQAIDYFERYLTRAPEAPDAALVFRDLQETALKLARRN